MLSKMLAAAAALATAEAQFMGGIGPACMRGVVTPIDVAEGAQCGGYCNNYGTCAKGLECQQQASSGAGLMIIGGGGPSYCSSNAAPASAPGGSDCAGCPEHVTGTTYEEETLEAARAAVGLINAQDNAMYGSQFVQIVPGTLTKQVVAGYRYTMSIQMAQTTCRNTGTVLDETTCPVAHGAQVMQYHVVLISQSWMPQPYTLVEFTQETVDAGSLESQTTKPTNHPVDPVRPAAPVSCGDGSMTICMVRVRCPAGTVSAAMDGCVGCVDPVTCLASGGH